MFQVIFTYDEESRLWEPSVRGASDETEAMQGFNAVVLTCRDVVVGLLHRTVVDPDGSIRIIPAV